jgi:hypothetical protein
MGNCVQIYDAPGARIVNNTFWQQAEGWPQALIIGSAGAVAPVGTIVRNNIVNRYQVQDPSWVSQDHNLIVEGPHVGSHDSTRAPSFDAQWRLAPGSSGIDAGDSAGAPSRDRFGHRRRDDPAVANVGSGRLPYVDIGALER